MAGGRHRHPAHRAAGDDVRRARGLTLVEVLVAMLLVLVVISGATAFVARGRAAHRTGESLARIEEALDAGFGLLVDEIHLAGYLGLSPPGTPVEGASEVGGAERADLAVAGSCGSSLAHDLRRPVVASNAAFAAGDGMPIGCRASPDGRASPSADSLVVRHASVEPAGASPGRLQVESSLRAAALSANGAATLGPEARRHDLEVGVYYVSLDSTGRRDWPSLRRKRLVGGTRPAFQDEELVAGIADFQVSLGLDDPADPDGAVDRWIDPGESADDGVLRALRIELEALSDVPERDQPALVRRKRASRVVELRNVAVAP
jgi:prepilin-type N-terminal cleavage/methylation domain-containing protein